MNDQPEIEPRRAKDQRLARKPLLAAALREEPANLWQRARAYAYSVLEVGNTGDPASIIFDALLVALIVANVLAAMFESVPSIDAVYDPWFDKFETASITIFTAEYLVRIWSSIEDPRYRSYGLFWGRVRFALQAVALIDLLAIGPSLLGLVFGTADFRVLRVFRLLRIMKIVRYSPALTTLTEVLRTEWRALLGTLLLLMCVMVLSAEVMYLVEGTANHKSFGTLPQSMYWAITTLTTVGYGDNVPITALGKLVSGITMIIGLGLFALPVGIVATNFVNEIHRRDFVVTWSMLAHFPLFRNFDIEIIVSLMSVLRSQVIREHAVVVMKGAPPEQMYFIVSGEARGRVESGTLQYSPGDYFGDTAIFRGEPHEATITARSDVRLLTLAAADLLSLSRKHPPLRRRLEQDAERREKRRQRRAKSSRNTGVDDEDDDT